MEEEKQQEEKSNFAFSGDVQHANKSPPPPPSELLLQYNGASKCVQAMAL